MRHGIPYPVGRNTYVLSWDPVYRKNPKEKKEKESKEAKESDNAQKQQATLKVTDQYIALLIRVFVAAGLLDVSAYVSLWNPRIPFDDGTVLGALVDVRGKH